MHVEDHTFSQTNRKRTHSVITHEAEEHDGEAGYSEADNDDGEPGSTACHNITVRGRRFPNFRATKGTRCAARCFHSCSLQ